MKHVVNLSGGARPLAIDLFCGLGGWTEGLLAEGYRVIGFDNERHVYGDAKYPGQLVIQDVLTLHGSQFKDAALIVASPPCQEYSYMAMPWSRAKAIAAEYRSGVRNVSKLTALFDACFRIQCEASEAAGRHIPLVVENVKGAQPWVGRAAWNFGSFYLWGDVPALMPIVKKRAAKGPKPATGNQLCAVRLDQIEGLKHEGSGWDDKGSLRSHNRLVSNQAHHEAEIKARDHNKARANGGNQWTADFNETIKNNGGSWFNIGSPGQKETNRNPVNNFEVCKDGSKSKARKAASATIAKIPFVLAQHIARAWKPS